MSHFHVGLTRDFLEPDGRVAFEDLGLSALDQTPGLTWELLAEDGGELRAHQILGCDALLLLGSRVSEKTLVGAERLLLIARFGVGYDNVDVEACTRNAVMLTITPDGVRRPVAASALALLLAQSHKILIKDRLTRAGRWAEKMDYMGVGLTGRVLGLVGLGNIGREVLSLARPFGMRNLAYDPYIAHDRAAQAGAELTDLQTLLRTADFVCITCQLTAETYHLVDTEELALMKKTAFIVNVARGPIINQLALTKALQERRIQGAALDVFEQEPIAANDPLLALDNVILTPHAVAWTDECFQGNGASACRSILQVARGEIPQYVVNSETTKDPRWLKKLERVRPSPTTRAY